jgi:hypothetical protein
VAGSTATPSGKVPTVMVAVTVLVAASITDTVPSASLVTYMVPAAGSAATSPGAGPTGMVAVTV